MQIRQWQLYGMQEKNRENINKNRVDIIYPVFIWARRDSNPRPKDYESSALPLRHRPVTTFVIQFSTGSALACATFLSSEDYQSSSSAECHRPVTTFVQCHPELVSGSHHLANFPIIQSKEAKLLNICLD